jgi:hypothetical protein
MLKGAHRHWRRHAAVAAAVTAVVAVAGLSGPSLRGARLALGDAARLDIGSITANATWLGVALAQSGNITLENVTLELGAITYRLPRIGFSDVSLSRAELTALFEGPAGEALAPRLARLTAREVRIPELRIEQAFGGVRQVTIYRDVVARDVVNGRVAALASAGATLETEGSGSARGGSGPLTVENLDLAHAATLFGQKADARTAEKKTVYTSFSLDDVRMSDAKGAEIRIARLSGKDFRARPNAQSWSEAMRLIGETPDLEKATPTERSRLHGVLADLLDAYEIGQMEASGVEIRNPTVKDQPSGRIARLAFAGGSAGQVADARAEGIEIASSKGRARVATIAATGFSWGDTLRGLKDSGGKADALDWRRLLPTIGTVRVSGVDVDMVGEAAKALKPENIRFGIKDVEVTADKPVNGIPSNLRIAVENLVFAVPASASEDGLKDLAAMGYANVDLSFATAATWNEAGGELVVREVSVRGTDMGSAVLRGVLANVGKDVFDPDSAVAMVALVGATARQVDLTLENRGLFERVIGQEARKQKKSPEDLRREYGMAAAIAVPSMLGNSGSAKAVGQAVARFVARPGRLTISARTKDPAGLGFADIAGMAEPAALLDKLEVTATAE